MQGPSGEGTSPNSAEVSEESTGGVAGSEDLANDAAKVRRTNEPPSEGPVEDPASDERSTAEPSSPPPTEPDDAPVSEPELVEGEIVEDLVVPDDGRGIKRVELDHAEVDLSLRVEDETSRGINRVDVDHPTIDLPPRAPQDPERGLSRVHVEAPDDLPTPENVERPDRGLNRVQLDAPADVQKERAGPDEARGINRIEFGEPPLRLPETWSGAKGNGTGKRVEIPHELDSILGIKGDDPESAPPADSSSDQERVTAAILFGKDPPTPAPSRSDPTDRPSLKTNPTVEPRHDLPPDPPEQKPVPPAVPPATTARQPLRPEAPQPAPIPGSVAPASKPSPLPAPAQTPAPTPEKPATPSHGPMHTRPSEHERAGPRTAASTTESATVGASPHISPATTTEPRPAPVPASAPPAPAEPTPSHANGNKPKADEATNTDTNPESVKKQTKKKTKKGAAIVGPRTGKWLRWFIGKPIHVEGTVTPIPTLGEGMSEVKLREYASGVSYSRVLFDRHRGRHRYEVLEPPLDDRETRSLQFIKEVLLRTLDVELEIVERAVAEESLSLLDERVKKVVRDYRMDLNQTSLSRILYFLRRDFTGYGPVDVMMHDPDIEDISCDGPRTSVFLYHRKFGSMESNVVFPSSDELDGFVIRMAQRSGKQITIADPLLDSSLPDGSRLQATLGREVTDNGSTFTIRRFRDNPLSPIDLVRMGTMSAELLAYCWIVVQYGANVMLAGGTASGKTTTLNTISLFIPPQSKIVSIEDTREINLPHKNWVRSVTRGATRGNDVKRVDMFDLLTAALRQRPEYILVGEVRGKEATVAFQAMATGHTVLGTIHADSPRSVVYRLESEPINIPRIVIQSLDVILMQALLSVGGRRQRRIQEVAEIVGIDPASKELLTHGVFQRNPSTDQLHYTGRSYKLQRIAQRNNWTPKELERELKRRTEIINRLVGMPTVTFDETAQVFSMYENRPDQVDAELERLRHKGQAEGTN